MTTDRTPPPRTDGTSPVASDSAPVPDPRGGFRLPAGTDARGESADAAEPAARPAATRGRWLPRRPARPRGPAAETSAGPAEANGRAGVPAGSDPDTSGVPLGRSGTTAARRGTQDGRVVPAPAGGTRDDGPPRGRTRGSSGSAGVPAPSGVPAAPGRKRRPDSTPAGTPPHGTTPRDGAAGAGPAGHPGDEDTAGAPVRGTATAAPLLRDEPGPETERLRYVGAATRRIARGLDLDEILLGLCRSAVPAFADAILVYLRDPLPVGDQRPSGPLVLRLRRSDGGLEEPTEQSGSTSATGALLPLVAVPALDPSYGGAAESTDVRMDGPLAEVLRGVRPVLADAPQAAAALAELISGGTSLDEAPVRLRHPASDPASSSGVVPLNLPTGRRALLAPLRGRRRVIGAAVLLRRPERAPFEAEDLLVAAQLATHTALGVDKAVLYGREAYIADALQREMLPDSLPQATGVQLASRYLPAAESARVGGDWYDAIPLPGSRVALVVGDVMGHSMTSAAIMGQLRTTVQTLAGLDLEPQEVLYHLDEQAQRLGSDRMATCVYVVYDPIAHRMVVANAGHPPPVLLHADGHVEVLRVPPGAPIGVGGVPFEAVELPAPAGATLVLYTDGLVESRTRDVWAGIDLLRERLRDAAAVVSQPPLEPLCDEVLEILGPGDRDDDIALLAARFDGIAPSDVAYWVLDPQPQTAGRARQLARRALRRWDLDHLLEPAELLVSEIVTNAVRYAERPITLRLLRTDVLRCEVGDDAPLLPRMRHAQPEEEGGRGLYLVNRMAQRWGATRLSAGKVVWFELSIPG